MIRNQNNQEQLSFNIFEFKYSTHDLEKYKMLLEQQKRNLVMLVHPFWHQQSNNELKNLSPKELVSRLLNTDTGFNDPFDNPNRYSLRRRKVQGKLTEISSRAYFARLAQLLTSANLFVLALGEYGPFLSATIAVLREFGYSGKILHYKSMHGNPVPDPSNGTWRDLGKNLNTLEPKNLIVGGQYNILNCSFPDRPSGCVPIFTERIKPYLNNTQVITSPVVYPNWAQNK